MGTGVGINPGGREWLLGAHPYGRICRGDFYGVQRRSGDTQRNSGTYTARRVCGRNRRTALANALSQTFTAAVVAGRGNGGITGIPIDGCRYVMSG